MHNVIQRHDGIVTTVSHPLNANSCRQLERTEPVSSTSSPRQFRSAEAMKQRAHGPVALTLAILRIMSPNLPTPARR